MEIIVKKKNDMQVRTFSALQIIHDFQFSLHEVAQLQLSALVNFKEIKEDDKCSRKLSSKLRWKSCVIIYRMRIHALFNLCTAPYSYWIQYWVDSDESFQFGGPWETTIHSDTFCEKGTRQYTYTRFRLSLILCVLFEDM